MNQNIIIEKADNALRPLAKGFAYQVYKAHAIRVVDQETFSTHFGNSFKTLKEAYGLWEGLIQSYINRRSAELGLGVGGVLSQLVEQPNEANNLEVLIWESKDTKFVWSIWAYLMGPVPEHLVVEEPIPIFAFWPSDQQYRGRVAEILDATKLSLREQGLLPGG